VNLTEAAAIVGVSPETLRLRRSRAACRSSILCPTARGYFNRATFCRARLSTTRQQRGEGVQVRKRNAWTIYSDLT